MRYPYKILGIAVFVALLFVPLAATTAQDATARRLNLIRDNCNTLHEAVDLQRRRDLVARTNRGREYESLNKQLDAFGQRLRNNHMDSQPFDRFFNEFQQASTEFRAAYTRYDNSLHSLIQTDCQKEPQKFSDTLAQARVLRSETGAAVAKADDVLSQYRVAVIELQAQLQKAAASQATREDE